MTNLLSGKCAMVTGGAQGIGAGIASVLISHGAKVAIIDRQKEKTEGTADRLNAFAVVADLSTPEGCSMAVIGAVKALGSLDILVNNAAPNRNRAMTGKIATMTDWSDHADLVIGSVPILVDAAAEFLRPGSSIVNISSGNGTAISSEQCSWAYHVSKSGLEQLTRWLACHLGPAGIRVNAVAPSLVDRETGQKLTDNPEYKKIIEEIVPLGRVGYAKDIGNATVFLSSPMASYISGQILHVDGGMGAREPFSVAVKTAKLHQ